MRQSGVGVLAERQSNISKDFGPAHSKSIAESRRESGASPGSALKRGNNGTPVNGSALKRMSQTPVKGSALATNVYSEQGLAQNQQEPAPQQEPVSAHAPACPCRRLLDGTAQSAHQVANCVQPSGSFSSKEFFGPDDFANPRSAAHIYNVYSTDQVRRSSVRRVTGPPTDTPASSSLPPRSTHLCPQLARVSVAPTSCHGGLQ
jgi:hypothetical protein